MTSVINRWTNFELDLFLIFYFSSDEPFILYQSIALTTTMHFLRGPNRQSKIYAEQLYNIPISNDFSHYGITAEKAEECKVVHEKKQIEKIMHGIVKERMFGNFIKDDTRVSLDNFTVIDEINKNSTNQRLRSNRFKSLSRTIETSDHKRLRDR